MINFRDMAVAIAIQVTVSLVVRSALIGFMAAVATLYILTLFKPEE